MVDARGPEASPAAAGRGYQKFLGLELGSRSPAPVEAAASSWTRRSPSRTASGSSTCCPSLPTACWSRTRTSPTRPRSTARRCARASTRTPRAQRLGRRARWCARRRASCPCPGAARFARAREGRRSRRATRAAASIPPPATRCRWRSGWPSSWPPSRPSRPAAPAARGLAREHARPGPLRRLLNWLLFCAYPPAERWHVLERFYRLPEATIERFYALELTLADRARLLLGRPPRGLSVRAAWSRLQAA